MFLAITIIFLFLKKKRMFVYVYLYSVMYFTIYEYVLCLTFIYYVHTLFLVVHCCVVCLSFFPFCFRTVIAFWLDPAEIWISGDITTGLLYRIVNVYWHNYFAFPV